MKKIIFFISFLIFNYCVFLTNLTAWESVAIWMFNYFFLSFLDDLGNKIIIMDMAVLMGLLTCLLVPVVFYHEYTKDNFLARLWVKYMPIQSDTYFSFVVPAMLSMYLGLQVPIVKLAYRKEPKRYIENAKLYLQSKPKLGLILIAVGLISSILDFLAPSELAQVFFLMAHLTYVGAFYILYSPHKRKKLIFLSTFALMLVQAVLAGMFGDMINMFACATVLILLSQQVSYIKKLSVALLGLVFIILIQSVKVEYRNQVNSQHTGGDPVYFASLIGDRISDPEKIIEPKQLFGIAVRLNQGWLVAGTMYNVPEHYTFAYGETIWQSVAAAIVPRFLWPDKPESGGKANLKRFWGYNLVGYSMNIGPLGEAYGNFDVTGGIIYMFFYGLFFNLLLSGIIKYAEKRPTLILWLPFLFFYTITMETDLLTTMGSLIKALMFTWIVFWLFRKLFRIDL